MTIENKLNTLSTFKALKETAEEDKQKLIDSVLTPEIRQQIADIETEFAASTATITANISSLENEIRDLVIANGGSVKGLGLHAVLSPTGKTTWDTAGLEIYAQTHPDVNAYKKVGSAYVTIRKAK